MYLFTDLFITNVIETDFNEYFKYQATVIKLLYFYIIFFIFWSDKWYALDFLFDVKSLSWKLAPGWPYLKTYECSFILRISCTKKWDWQVYTNNKLVSNPLYLKILSSCILVSVMHGKWLMGTLYISRKCNCATLNSTMCYPKKIDT